MHWVMIMIPHRNAFCATDPLGGESTDHRWIYFSAERWCFLWYTPEPVVIKPWNRQWFETLWWRCDVLIMAVGISLWRPRLWGMPLCSLFAVSALTGLMWVVHHVGHQQVTYQNVKEINRCPWVYNTLIYMLGLKPSIHLFELSEIYFNFPLT